MFQVPLSILARGHCFNLDSGVEGFNQSKILCLPPQSPLLYWFVLIFSMIRYVFIAISTIKPPSNHHQPTISIIVLRCMVSAVCLFLSVGHWCAPHFVSLYLPWRLFLLSVDRRNTSRREEFFFPTGRFANPYGTYYNSLWDMSQLPTDCIKLPTEQTLHTPWCSALKMQKTLQVISLEGFMILGYVW